jgi:hypothetical protein
MAWGEGQGCAPNAFSMKSKSKCNKAGSCSSSHGDFRNQRIRNVVLLREKCVGLMPHQTMMMAWTCPVHCQVHSRPALDKAGSICCSQGSGLLPKGGSVRERVLLSPESFSGAYSGCRPREYDGTWSKPSNRVIFRGSRQRGCPFGCKLTVHWSVCDSCITS